MGNSLRKLFINASRLEEDSWRFAHQLYEAGHDFDLFAGVARGGAQIGIYMQEVFALMSGQRKYFAAVQVRSYDGIADGGEVEICTGSLESVVKHLRPGLRILVIDDVFDRGRTFQTVRNAIRARIAGREVSLKLAALYYKPGNREVAIEPDFHYQTFGEDEWLVLPHELIGLTESELAAKGYTCTQKP
ncbi:MAG: phosphoribosyltransferase [Planctomycetes bacterium]|nr:phosphoribosyltransferase [Planctomycetota bacterium]